MRKALWWGLLCGMLWLASVGGAAWLLHRFALAPRPGDFERIAMFRMGLDAAMVEVECLGLRPPYRAWHKDQDYVNLLFFAQPASCDTLQHVLDIAHQPFSLRAPERRF